MCTFEMEFLVFCKYCRKTALSRIFLIFEMGLQSPHSFREISEWLRFTTRRILSVVQLWGQWRWQVLRKSQANDVLMLRRIAFSSLSPRQERLYGTGIKLSWSEQHTTKSSPLLTSFQYSKIARFSAVFSWDYGHGTAMSFTVTCTCG